MTEAGGVGLRLRLSAGRFARQVKSGKKVDDFRALTIQGIGTKPVGEVRPVAHSSATSLPVRELAQLTRSLAHRLLLSSKSSQWNR
jgi:hypothetical protein